jgi:hypothetical protein
MTIQITNATKDCKVYIMISLWITKWSNAAEKTNNTRLDQQTKDLSRNTNKQLKDNTWNMGALRNQWMQWDYGSSKGNCWKNGKFALGAVLLGMAWKLSQMMRPGLILNTGNCRTLLLVILDPGWIPLGEYAPLSLAKCILVIPPSKSDELCLKMTTLVYWEMGQKGIPEYGLMLALEPQMYPPNVSHVQVWKMRPC